MKYGKLSVGDNVLAAYDEVCHLWYLYSIGEAQLPKFECAIDHRLVTKVAYPKQPHGYTRPQLRPSRSPRRAH